MNDKHKKLVDPIPEEFASYEEAAEFWDTHDTTDYLDSFKTMPVEATLRSRQYEVKIDEDLLQILHEQAQQRGVGVNQLVNTVLRETLGNAA